MLGLPWCLRRLRICPQCRRPRFHHWGRKILWRTEWQPTPVFLPAEFRGQRSLLGYNPRSRIELDMAEWLTFSLCMWMKDSLHVTRSRKCMDFTKLSMWYFFLFVFYVGDTFIGEKTLKAGAVKNCDLCSIFPNLSSWYYVHRCSITSASPLFPIN